VSRRGRILVVLLALAGGLFPPEVAAQSSMFGVRGLGLPGEPLSARTRGTGRGFALFDGESDLNPAAITTLPALTVGLVSTPGWRRWDTPAGEVKLQDTRFPLMFAGGPIPAATGESQCVSRHADRPEDVTRDTVIYRGHPSQPGTRLPLSAPTSCVACFAPVAGPAWAVYWITGSHG
jgi:hypothetical protein